MKNNDFWASRLATRTEHSVRNMVFAIFSQGIITFLSFVCRTVFIHQLGKTYLGFNGLFSDIFSLLSLAELGIESVILYEMYQAAGKENLQELAELLKLFKKLYFRAGAVIGGLCVLFLPVLSFVVSDIPKVPLLPVYYLLYVSNSVMTYFFSYNRSLLIVYQEQSIESILNSIFGILLNVIQMVYLYFFSDYIGYLVLMNIATLLNNISLRQIVRKRYPQVFQWEKKTSEKVYLDEQVKIKLRKNVKARFVSKLSTTVVTYTDNLMISAFVSTAVLGIYSNYTLIAYVFKNLLNTIFNALKGSIGQLVATESNEKVYQTFKNIMFLNFWMVSYLTGAFYVLVDSFIRLWIGADYILPVSTVLLFCINMHVRLLRNPLLYFNDVCGHFVQLKRKNIWEALLNIVFSSFFLFVCHWGIAGILLGTFCSDLCTNFWFEPFLLYTRFQKDVKDYFIRYFLYIVTWILGSLFSLWVCQCISVENGILNFLIHGLVCTLVLNTCFFVLWGRCKEFQFLKSVLLHFLKKRRGY